MSTAEAHTIEHLGATFLRNHPVWKERTVYFGPMGCRTGFYMILHGNLESRDVVDLVKEMFQFICNFEGDIPGATAKECGNYLDQNLPVAKYWAKRYLENTLNNIDDKHLVYPEQYINKWRVIVVQSLFLMNCKETVSCSSKNLVYALYEKLGQL